MTMTSPPPWFAFAVAAALAASSRNAAGQSAQAQQRAAAQTLFEQATHALDAKQYDEACPKLEEVVKLQPTGVGAKLTLAECYESAGKLASAWGAYVAAEASAANAGQPDRATLARSKARALEPRLARLTLTMAPAARNTPGLAVDRDGIPVGATQWGVPLPIDKGKHVVTAAAPGKEKWSATVDVRADGLTVPLTVPALQDAANESVAPQEMPATQGEPSGVSPGAAATAAPVLEEGNRTPTWVWVTGGVGIAMVAAAAAFAVDGASANATLKDKCGPDLVCPPDFGDKDSLNRRKNVGLGMGIGLGVAGVAAASVAVATLVKRSRRGNPPSVRIRLTPAIASAIGVGLTADY